MWQLVLRLETIYYAAAHYLGCDSCRGSGELWNDIKEAWNAPLTPQQSRFREAIQPRSQKDSPP